jgi:hypothetical protein
MPEGWLLLLPTNVIARYRGAGTERIYVAPLDDYGHSGKCKRLFAVVESGSVRK